MRYQYGFGAVRTYPGDLSVEKSRTGCRAKTIRIDGVDFTARLGKGCKKRPAPTHLTKYQDAFRAASQICKGQGPDFRACMSAQMPISLATAKKPTAKKPAARKPAARKPAARKPAPKKKK